MKRWRPCGEPTNKGVEMTNDEMQVLRALEIGLEYAEAAFADADCNRKEMPEWYAYTKVDVAKIVIAIDVVKCWDTKWQ